MKLTPPAALSRIAQRFQERRARAALGERPPLTSADEDNLARFAGIVEDLTALLAEENEALRAGDTARVAALFARKTEALHRLEVRQPVVEPFLRDSEEIAASLRGRLRALAAQIQQNAALLQSMSEAAQTIRTEVARVRDRHSLRGMYDKAGQSLDGSAPGSRTGIDSKL